MLSPIPVGNTSLEVDLVVPASPEQPQERTLATLPRVRLNIVDTSRCTLPQCWSPCVSSAFKVHAPLPTNPPRGSSQHHALLAAVRASPYHTARLEEACVVVPDVDSLCMYNQCTWSGSQLTTLLGNLPTWGADGRNHLLFRLSDHSHRSNLGLAAVARSSPRARPGSAAATAAPVVNVHTAEQRGVQHRGSFDATFPLAFFRRGASDEFAHLHRFPTLCALDTPASPPRLTAPSHAFHASRPTLLSFLGARYNDSTTPLRARVRVMNASAPDILIYTYCSWEAAGLVGTNTLPTRTIMQRNALWLISAHCPICFPALLCCHG